MFRVKALLLGFDMDEEKYPCHFCHLVGDEIIYDGAEAKKGFHR